MNKLFKKYISPIMLVFFVLYYPSYSQMIPVDSLYLGQIPPSYIPQIFHIPFTMAYPSDRMAISPDGKEICYGEIYPSPTFTTLSRIKHYTYSKSTWRGPSVLFDGYATPAFSISGDTLFLQKRDSLFFKKHEGDHTYTYFSVRNDSGWSAPSRFTKGVDMGGLQVTNSGNYYASINTLFLGVNQGKISKVVINDSNVSFQCLGIPTGNENDFFVSMDESFSIFTTPNRGGFGGGDIFISYRKNDSSWTNPKNLGSPLNTEDWEHGPYVTPDNKHLIFLRTGEGYQVIYWARIDKVIDSLKHTNFAPYLKSQIPSQTSIVGFPFKLQIPDNTFFDDDGNNTLTYSTTLSSGNPLPAWLSFSVAKQVFSGIPTAADTLSIKVTATDTANASASCTFNLQLFNKK
jgi:hypothetical protein